MRIYHRAFRAAACAAFASSFLAGVRGEPLPLVELMAEPGGVDGLKENLYASLRAELATYPPIPPSPPPVDLGVCSVCQSEITDGDPYVMLNCGSATKEERLTAKGHHLHEACFHSAYRYARANLPLGQYFKCPNCRNGLSTPQYYKCGQGPPPRPTLKIPPEQELLMDQLASVDDFCALLHAEGTNSFGDTLAVACATDEYDILFGEVESGDRPILDTLWALAKGYAQDRAEARRRKAAAASEAAREAEVLESVARESEREARESGQKAARLAAEARLGVSRILAKAPHLYEDEAKELLDMVEGNVEAAITMAATHHSPSKSVAREGSGPDSEKSAFGDSTDSGDLKAAIEMSLKARTASPRAGTPPEVKEDQCDKQTGCSALRKVASWRWAAAALQQDDSPLWLPSDYYEAGSTSPQKSVGSSRGWKLPSGSCTSAAASADAEPGGPGQAPATPISAESNASGYAGELAEVMKGLAECVQKELPGISAERLRDAIEWEIKNNLDVDWGIAEKFARQVTSSPSGTPTAAGGAAAARSKSRPSSGSFLRGGAPRRHGSESPAAGA